MNRALALAATFLGCILAANYVTTEYGMIPVGFGLVATAGTYFAGFTFVLRDSLQDLVGGPWQTRSRRDHLRAAGVTAVVIALGAGLSLALALTWFRADPTFLPPGVTAASIAIASGSAFLCSELVDLGIYTPLRRKGYIRAAIASNIAGALVDTILFLWIAGFPIANAIAGQLVGKVAITALAVTAVAAYRIRRVVTT